MQVKHRNLAALTDSQVENFLTAIATGASILEAAGDESTRRKLYRLRVTDRGFAQRWEESWEAGMPSRTPRAEHARQSWKMDAPTRTAALRRKRRSGCRPTTEKLGVVYVIGSDVQTLPVKIGWTGIDPHTRLNAIQVGSPVKLKLLGVLPGPRSLERAMHRQFREYRLHGEWFEPAVLDHLN